nr:hypothetical protein [Tanacetum cinerariifolium]
MDEGTTSNLTTWRDVKEGLESLLTQLRELNKQREVINKNQGIDRNLQIPCYAFQNPCHSEVKIEEKKDVHKVFKEMPVNKLLTKYDTVKAYFDSFSSLFSKSGFDEWYLVDLFICGLPAEIEKGVSVFKPRTLSDANGWANLQEATYKSMIKNSNPPLFYSFKFDDSKEGVKIMWKLKEMATVVSKERKINTLGWMVLINFVKKLLIIQVEWMVIMS